MQRLLCFFCVLLTVLLLVSSCAGGKTAPVELLSDFCASYGEMPAGQVYHSGAAEWEEGYLSPALADGLFLEDNGENAFSLCRAYAIFLSSSFEGGEIAFLSCAGREDAVRVAEMCTARLARIKQTKPDAAILQDACVLRHGNTVVLLLLPDNIRAKEICKRLL
ncbi:MAG: hypothetical protein IJY20_00980 [Clostridia bacterium]|nr:hypothetical protein [Clostridia bacterium]